MPPKASDITITDQFCGAGGSSIGATAAGGRLRMALNHWQLAIETHNTNFPDADHDCTDISACDPRRYPSTDILITSPECTNHSLAKGAKRKGKSQRDIFQPPSTDPAAERSRATMWDVCRFAEYHKYEIIIVENVVEARHWVCFDAWTLAMTNLGYDHRSIYLNSMFCWPTPQSRDRMYIVFWRQGNPAPDLDIHPPAYCTHCNTNVASVQSWKPNRSWGRYDRQYIYCCPTCARRVEPYYYAALNALDFSIPAERIGDRKRPLRPRTLERIRYGLERYGRQPLQVITNMTTDHGRVRSAIDPGFTQTGSAITALVHPIVLHARSNPVEPRNANEALPTLTCSDRLAVAIPPAALINNMENNRARSTADPLHTVCTGGNIAIALPPAFLATLRETANDQLPASPSALDDALGTLTAGGVHHGLVINGSALMTMRDSKGGYLLRALSDPLPTQVAASTQDCVISRNPFLVSYYGANQANAPTDPMGTLTTRDRHALVEADQTLDVDDCFFRMLQPPEVGLGMAFPDTYEVLGTKKNQVKQYGNAVTPPVMATLSQRAIASLTGERTA